MGLFLILAVAIGVIGIVGAGVLLIVPSFRPWARRRHKGMYKLVIFAIMAVGGVTAGIALSSLNITHVGF